MSAAEIVLHLDCLNSMEQVFLHQKEMSVNADEI